MLLSRKCKPLIHDICFGRAQSTLVEEMKAALTGYKSDNKKDVKNLYEEEKRDEKGDPFREFFVKPKRKLRTQQDILKSTGRATVAEKPKADLYDRLAIRRPRMEEMKTDQDWPSVWPVAASFRSSVVPLPIRMGTRKNPEKKPPFKTAGNLELLKIPNFLHLTPEAIERHCKAIKKFCTKWPAEFDDSVQLHQTNYPLLVSFSDYVHQGTSLRDTRSRIIVLKLKLSALHLDSAAKDKIRRLLGSCYCEKTDTITLVTDRCYTRKQNLDYVMYLLTALYHEARKVEPWEKMAQREDDLKVKFIGSEAEKAAIELLNKKVLLVSATVFNNN
uniref:MRP-S28 domain-containing protein n=1 Tax=Syphacia muris TaxID=451379 RepID=A0A0N5AIZ9_9BILA